MNYKELDLKVGLEIHQELDTEHKLFCSCPPMLGGEPEYSFERRLRPSQSELGRVDPAALFEFLKGKTIRYQADTETTCLVEMDEEPPFPLDREALNLTLIFSLMVGANPVDEIHVMRKTVVDGSNTGGFQRTCVVSLGGEVEAGGKSYGLEQICLEEDAARKAEERGKLITYRLDRLGIPLMEITTAPDIHTPNEAKEVAHRIGSLLRATGKVKRGLGTIRQDLNVSIKNGSVIEIKGVQDLNLISTVVEYEAQRQLNLLEIAKELKKRGVRREDIVDKFVDVSDVFRDTESRIIGSALESGKSVWALRLQGFNGLMGRELCPGRRLGTEMADHATARAGVKGIFHTDELPGYSITQEEVKRLREKTDASQGDAVVIVADEEERCERALLAVVERGRDALSGVPEETRSANPDGTTRYTRPRPGAARMYPETDIKTINMTADHLKDLRSKLPERPEEQLDRFMEDYNLNEKLATQVVDSEYMEIFEDLAKEMKAETTLIAVTLTEDLTKLRRDGIPVKNLDETQIIETFSALDKGRLVKESIPDVLGWLAENPDASVEDALEALELELMDEDELRVLVEEKLEENEEMLDEMGMKAFGPLMGAVMSEIRGRADAQKVQRAIREALNHRLE